MKIILEPLFKFIYAAILTLVHLPFNVIVFCLSLFWEFNVKKAYKTLEYKGDIFTEIIYPYKSKRITYKTSLHAIWNII